MQIKKIASWLVIGLSVMALSACEKGAQESPEEVIQKFKSAATEIQAGDLSVNLVMQGVDAEDNLDFNGDLDIKFDRRDDQTRKADINVSVSGNMQTKGRALDGNLVFEFLTIANDFYIKLDKLESSDASVKTLQPLLKAYSGKWLQLAPELIPENVRELQKKDEETLAKEEKIKTLFINADLFSVNKEFGVETVNGKKAYHYGIHFNEDAIKNYMRSIAAIDNSEVDETQLNEAVRLIDSITEAELWIGTDDYFLYKGTVTLNGATGSEVEMKIQVAFEANSYNRDLSIEAPKDAEEFNPLALLGAGAIPESELPLETLEAE